MADSEESGRMTAVIRFLDALSAVLTALAGLVLALAAIVGEPGPNDGYVTQLDIVIFGLVGVFIFLVGVRYFILAYRSTGNDQTLGVQTEQ